MLERFEMVKTETGERNLDAMSMTIHLDERMNKGYREHKGHESLGLMEAASVTDFPVRDHKVVLKSRRRRWNNKGTGESFVGKVNVTGKDTRYSKKDLRLFQKRRMGTSPVTCRTFEEFYRMDVGHPSGKRYEGVLSGFRSREQSGHAGKWLLSADNTDPRLAIDESSPSNGEACTFVTYRDAHARERGSVAVVAGTKPEDTVEALRMTGEDRRDMVEEVALGLSGSMRKTVRTAFPKASRAIDRFHIQELACDAVQGLRIRHRRVAMRQSDDEMEEDKLDGTPYAPSRCSNGDTRMEFPTRSRHLLFNPADIWTGRQKGKATILFDGCPDIKEAYGPCHSLTCNLLKGHNQGCRTFVHGTVV